MKGECSLYDHRHAWYLGVDSSLTMLPVSLYSVAIIQRVLSASVTVDKEVISSIGRGVLVFAAVAPGDSEKEAQQIANKVIKMKLWDDENGGRVCTHALLILHLKLFALSCWALLIIAQWKKSVMDMNGEVLCGMLIVEAGTWRDIF